jgi:hypothetical protein
VEVYSAAAPRAHTEVEPRVRRQAELKMANRTVYQISRLCSRTSEGASARERTHPGSRGSRTIAIVQKSRHLQCADTAHVSHSAKAELHWLETGNVRRNNLAHRRKLGV